MATHWEKHEHEKFFCCQKSEWNRDDVARNILQYVRSMEEIKSKLEGKQYNQFKKIHVVASQNISGFICYKNGI